MALYGDIEVRGDNPFLLFDEWYGDAAGGISGDPSAMVLSTSGRDGGVSSRVVLLKEHCPGGFIFYTNYDSHKAAQLADNLNTALLFYWPHRGRQVRIEGIAEKVSAEKSEEYFISRPYGSRLGAWASRQSSVIKSPAEITDRINTLKSRFGSEVPRPPHWGGYRVVPCLFEFWQEGVNRLHSRLRWRKVGEEWHAEMVAP